MSVFDKHSLRVLFTFARDAPPARADVLVVIISMLSSAPTPVTNIRFQAAVPKVGSHLFQTRKGLGPKKVINGDPSLFSVS